MDPNGGTGGQDFYFCCKNNSTTAVKMIDALWHSALSTQAQGWRFFKKKAAGSTRPREAAGRLRPCSTRQAGAWLWTSSSDAVQRGCRAPWSAEDGYSSGSFLNLLQDPTVVANLSQSSTPPGFASFNSFPYAHVPFPLFSTQPPPSAAVEKAGPSSRRQKRVTAEAPATNVEAAPADQAAHKGDGPGRMFYRVEEDILLISEKKIEATNNILMAAEKKLEAKKLDHKKQLLFKLTEMLKEDTSKVEPWAKELHQVTITKITDALWRDGGN
uniref:No apical meristem-associated C-terminal domain-containing protein n=1 Tax=Leersia perrieri TaxID=77586 RepID=A0A0D9WEJ4_9ORYZ